jgi:hypothetical protein
MSLPADPHRATHRALVTPQDPIAFAYVDLDNFGRDESLLRWAALADSLRAQGAPEATIGVLADRVLAEALAPATLAVFAGADGNLLHAQHLGDTRLVDRAGYAAPACVVPLLAWSQERPPFVLAVIDRAGADVTAGSGGGGPTRTWTVTGPDDEIERNAPGGWSQPRYQRRAEDSWRHNAATIAESVMAGVDEVGAQVVVLSGDTREVALVSERLPEPSGLLVQHISGSRSRDGSQQRRPDDLERALREAAGRQTEDLLNQFRARLNPGGLAVEGIRPTIDAIAAGAVACLLITEDHHDVTAWYGRAGTDIYPDHDAAVAAGLPARAGYLTDVAVRAALLSDAAVRVVGTAPGGPVEGIGALCRFSARAG